MALPITAQQSMTRDDYVPVADIAFQDGLKFFTVPGDAPASLFQIVGSDYSQVVEINLAPGQVVSFEPGTMMHMSDGIEPEVDVGDFGQACTRMCCLNESFFRLNLHNTSGVNRVVALTPSFPARVVPVNMANYPAGLFVSSRTFLGAFGTTWSVKAKMVNSFVTGVFGGQGFFLNLVESNSWVFLAAGGTVLEKHLAEGEIMVCDPKSVVAFEPSVAYAVKQVGGGALTCLCGGMGLFNTMLRGPGLVLLSSMPVGKLKRSLGLDRGQQNNNNNNFNDRNNGNNGGSYRSGQTQFA